MKVYLVHHIHHAAFLDGRPTQHRDESGELIWDEHEGDDLKILGIFSSEAAAEPVIERARKQPGFRDEPDCFLVSPHTVDDDEWAQGFVTESGGEQPEPHTIASLTSDLHALGLSAGDTLLLHSSQRSLGFVAGGTHAVVQAFVDVLGSTGTLVVPTHTPDNTDPAAWRHPPVQPSWWAPIRASSPGFDAARTPSRGMGVIAEAVRTWPGTVRSNHPQRSFAALGARAGEVVRAHRLDDALGDDSPLGALYRAGGKVLLLGCGYDCNTSLHLAEWRHDSSARAETGSSVLDPDGANQWVKWSDVVPDGSDFVPLGDDFELAGGAVVGAVGDATARLMSQPALVNFATRWMTTRRGHGGDS